ncbi:MAG: response regulator [Rhodospirillales bacterium]|nr:response regulator [Rhodospirillales bacterium]
MILAIASLNFSVMLFVIWRINPREVGAAYWSAALLVGAVRSGLLVLGHQGAVWTFLVTDALYSVVLGVAILGAFAFVRRHSPVRQVVLAIAATAAALVAVRLLQGQADWIVFAHAVASIAAFVVIGALFLGAWRADGNAYHAALALTFLLWAAIWFVVPVAEPSSTLGGLTVLVRAALQVAATVTVALMAQSRLTQRLRAEIADRTLAEQRFQDMIETASDWYWEIDADMRFTFMSPSIERMSGKPASEYIGRTREEIYGAASESAGWDEARRLINERKPMKDLRRQSTNPKTGRSYVYTISGKPVFNDFGRFVAYRGSGRDLTKHEETETALALIRGGIGGALGTDYMRALTQHLAEALRADLVFIGRVNEQRDRVRTLAFWCDGQIVANTEYPVAGSPTARMLAGQACVHVDSVRELYPGDAALARRGIRGYVGVPLLDDAGKAIGNIVVQTLAPLPNPELTETVVKTLATRAAAELQRQIADERLRESEHRLREIVDHMPIGFVLKRGNRFVMVNKTYSDWVGMPTQEVESMTDSEVRARLGWPLQLQGEIDANQREVAQLGRNTIFERRLPMAGGKERTILGVSFRVERNESAGNIIGIAMNDVTELRELESSLIQAQKMDALGRLAGGIAHDFNNIVGAIAGYARFIAEDAAPGTETRTYADRIQAASARARDLIQQILAFSRRAEIDREPISVKQLVEEAANMLRATLPAATRLQLDVAAADVTIEADATQMSQVLLNVCMNASDSLGGRQGKVTLSVSTHGGTEAASAVGRPEALHGVEDGRARYSVGSIASERRYVSIMVSDTGDGMSPETLARIFEPFFTTKPKGQGTGLGLPVVHGIVLAHGGAITVESRQGDGTTFRFWFPITERRQARPAGNSSLTSPTGRGRILVIDDDDHFGDMAAICLERLGYEAAIVSSPTDALETFGETPTLWDLVLTDQTMPEVSGIDVIRRVKRLRPDIPCILCTGFSEPANDQIARAAGADAYLTKPVDLTMLAQVVAHLVGRPSAALPSPSRGNPASDRRP